MEGLKAWLIGNGYEIYSNHVNREGNLIDWYAAKRSDSIRECGCNDKSPQIIIWPVAFTHLDDIYESVSVDISGEHYGLWWKLESYSLSPDALIKNLGMIEESLIKAWEAL
jgi:hypothetical protein